VPLLLGDGVAMSALRTHIDSAARTSAKVLITGQTGVGKEVVARLIHLGGARRAGPCVAVNCSGIPESLLASELFGHTRGSFTGAYRDKTGLLRQADGGTLFLDELGEMSLAMQAMLLRFTETGEVQPVGASGSIGRTDVRLITATNRDLPLMIQQGTFREDLYYRFNVVHIRVPPLCERGADDVRMLLRHYLMHSSRAHGLSCPQLSPAAETYLLEYEWPGNVRELRNVAERLALRDLRHPFELADLPDDVKGTRERATARSRSNGRPAAPSERHSGAPIRTKVAARLWEELLSGADFWSVVHRPFREREVTRADLMTLVDWGLQHTRGSYRALVRLFNLPDTDYKRFHAFLYQQNCNLAVAPYRAAPERVALPSAPA
jgi:DNA-binding NtrC family response regulator